MTHIKLLWEMRQSEPETEKKYNSTQDLKEGQLVLIKDHKARAFQPKYLADYRIIKVINENTVIVVSTDDRERKCNIHQIKPISPAEAFTQSLVQRQPHYNLWSNHQYQHENREESIHPPRGPTE